MSPVLEERMLAAIGDAKTCPHGHPISRGRARSQGVPLADVEQGAKRHDPALRERGRGAPALPQGRRAWSPAWRARSPSSDDDDGRGRLRRRRPRRSPAQRRRDRLRPRRPVAARRAPRCPSSSCSPRTATAGTLAQGARFPAGVALGRNPLGDPAGAASAGRRARRGRAGGRARPRRRRSACRAARRRAGSSPARGSRG